MTTMDDYVDGTRPAVVRRARERGDPLPGSDSFPGAGSLQSPDSPPDSDTGAGGAGAVRGFAGVVDGAALRDVLGRRPVYTEADDATARAFDPDELSEPDPVPAGHARTPAGEERVWGLPDPDPADDERATVGRVRAAVRESIDAVDEVGLAVAFSGGVDSTAVAARVDAPLYVAGFEGSHDVETARRAADALDRDLRVVELVHDTIERVVPEIVAATGRTNAMDVGIAIGLYAVAERAASDGFDRLAVGQGADELFGGYAKVANAPADSRVAADTVRGARREVVRTLPEQLERDVLALRGAGVEPVAPLLDDRVVAAALPLPGPLLVAGDGQRKVAFRRAVGEWVPDSAVAREKKAVQYGSLAARELDRLARQAGFKRRMDDHVTKYVESLATK
jgi:asparagine synthase (glutamine-hydrolysing)